MEKIKEIETRLAEHYTVDKCILKVVEECMELSEVLVKYLTKAEGYKPSTEKITEEAGDVLFRIEVLARKLQIKDDINERYINKSLQMDEWMNKKLE